MFAAYRIPRLREIALGIQARRGALCARCVNPLENIFPLITECTVIYDMYKLYARQFYIVNYRDIKVAAYIRVRLLGQSNVPGYENKDVRSILHCK